MYVAKLLLSKYNVGNGRTLSRRRRRGAGAVGIGGDAVRRISERAKRRISERLIGLTAEIPGIGSTATIILKHFTVIKMSIGGGLSHSRIKAVGCSITRDLGGSPRNTETVMITSPSVGTELQRVTSSVRGNRPLRKVVGRLTSVTNQLVPRIPTSLISPGGGGRGGTARSPGGGLSGSRRGRLRRGRRRRSGCRGWGNSERL